MIRGLSLGRLIGTVRILPTCVRSSAEIRCKHGALAKAEEDLQIHMVRALYIGCPASGSKPADHDHVRGSPLPLQQRLAAACRGSVSENVDRKKAEVFEEIGVEADDEEEWKQLSEQMPNKRRRL